MQHKILFTTFILLNAFNVFASSLEHRVDQLEKKLKNLSIQTPVKTTGARNPSGLSSLSSSYGIITDVGTSYLKGSYFSSRYAVKTQQKSEATTTVENYYYPYDMKWGWGFNLTLGLAAPSIQSSATVNYLYYSKASHSRTNSASTVETLTLISSSQDTSSSVSFASGDTRIQAHLIDALFSQKFYLSKAISLCLNSGLRSRWNDLRLLSKGESADSLSHVTPLLEYFYNKNKLFGIGPVIGLAPRIDIGYGFSMGPNFLAGLLYSKVTNYTSSKIDVQEVIERDTDHTIFRSLDLGYSLDYYSSLNEGSQSIHGSIAFDVKDIQGRFYTDSIPLFGYMSLYGITSKIGFDF